MKKMTEDEFRAALDSQNVPRMHAAFKCPACGTIQSGYDFIKAGAGETFEEISGFIGFSCLGRFTNADPPREKPDGNPCNWTLGGFFRIHTLEVVIDGDRCPFFEPATAAEANVHMADNIMSSTTSCSANSDCRG